MKPSLFVGTSGFSYDDWVGSFYPPGLKKSKWFEYYASEFNCLEINVSYYTWLSLAAAKSLAERAPNGFVFSIKLHRSLTHGKKEDLEESIRATGEQNRVFEKSGSLATHLAQFPNSFRPTDENWERLSRIANGIKPITIEFRNSEWQTDDVLDKLRKLKVSLCCVDQPQLEGLLEFRPELLSSPAYIRLHGRNAEKWYGHEKAWQRYDYLYSDDELLELKPPIESLSKRAEKTMVVFNNHYGAQAVTNARQMAALLGAPTKPAQGKLL